MRRVMIIEDNQDNRMLLRAVLDDSYAITEYTNGAEGLAALASDAPELLLLDISLPGMDGVEVLRRIRADPLLCHLPVVAFTAHAMSNDREKYLAHGFDDYITKPIVDETILLGSIARLLDAVTV